MTPAIRKVVRIDPMVTMTKGQVLGKVVPIVLDCGHVSFGNPIFDYSKETQRRCYKCETGA